jgi:hypothetical protein
VKKNETHSCCWCCGDFCPSTKKFIRVCNINVRLMYTMGNGEENALYIVCYFCLLSCFLQFARACVTKSRLLIKFFVLMARSVRGLSGASYTPIVFKSCLYTPLMRDSSCNEILYFIYRLFRNRFCRLQNLISVCCENICSSVNYHP